MRQQQLFPTSELPTTDHLVNVASVPQRSPFRYPGGKTWLVPVFRRWLASLPTAPDLLIETFAGGAIIGLTAACEKLTGHVILVELDADVAAVWKTVLCGDAEWLASRIVRFELSTASLQNELASPAQTARAHAFHTILRNRTAHGGILADGAGVIKTGEGGRGLASR